MHSASKAAASDKHEEVVGLAGISWHALPLDTIFTLLVTSRDGLAPDAARRRLLNEGPNPLRKTTPAGRFRVLLRQFGSPMLRIIRLCRGLAPEKVSALQQVAALTARVRRGGKILRIPAEKITRGDILELEAGDRVAADARLIETDSLQCVETPLTGESAPVLKRAVNLGGGVPLAQRENMVFMGASVAGGAGIAVVVATGIDTEIGQIAGLTEADAKQRTSRQKSLYAPGRLLLWAALGAAALLLLLSRARG